MRKIIAILVGLAMLFSIPALGEETDFSKMSIDELGEMYAEFIKEFQSRTEEQYGGSLIFEGDYVAGKDIKPGRYQFICIAADHYSKLLFSKLNDGQNWGIFDGVDVDIESTLPLYFTIEDGIRLTVYDCYGVLIPSDLTEKPVWMP